MGGSKLNSGKNFGEPQSTGFIELDRVNNITDEYPDAFQCIQVISTTWRRRARIYSLDTPVTGEIFWTPIATGNQRIIIGSAIDDAEVKIDLILAHYNIGYHSLKQLDDL